MTLIFGGEQVLASFKASREVSTIPAVIRVLEVAFGTPSKLRFLWKRDTTGLYQVPLEGSEPMEPHNRINHQLHKVHHTNMSGSGLASLGSDFAKFLEIELKSLDIGDEWTDIEDFYALVQKVAFRASVTAIYGPHLLRLNPNFEKTYWQFDNGIPTLFQSYPRWLVPTVYEKRDELHKCMGKWHTHAKENFDWNDESVAKQEWEEYYGSKL